MTDNRQQTRRHASPDEPITAHPGSSVNKILIRVDANALSIVALIIAAAATVIVLVGAIKDPQIVDAKIAAGVARTEAKANAAEVNARYAVAEIENLRTQLAAKGITIPKADH